MKQHITEEQLGELTAGEKNNLFEYFNNKNLMPHFTHRGPTMMMQTENQFITESICFNVNIGQMIEFLDREYQRGDSHSLSIKRGVKGWILWEIGEEKKELCDALWEAVKMRL